jgi:hypothetical protein
VLGESEKIFSKNGGQRVKSDLLVSKSALKFLQSIISDKYPVNVVYLKNEIIELGE